MKINVDLFKPDARFGIVKVGDCFRHKNSFYIRIEDCTEETFSGEIYPRNAVSLASGELFKFDDSTLVEPLPSAKVIL